MTTRLHLLLSAVLGFVSLAGCSTTLSDEDVAPDLAGGSEASGSFQRAAPPEEPPLRVEAGESCIVQTRQLYVVSGTLSGTFEIDYRILVHGPCGALPGTFDEEWIAYGSFAGEWNGAAAATGLTYVATVHAGGAVEGRIVLGPQMEGELRVLGDLDDGFLDYAGWVRAAP